MINMFDNKLNEIRRKRMEAEVALYESKLLEFANFDPAKEMLINKDEAIGHLKDEKFMSLIISSVSLAAVGGFMLGSSILLSGSPAFVGGILLAGVSATFLGLSLNEIQKSVKFIFKTIDDYEIEFVEKKFKELKESIEKQKIEPVTFSDYFNTTKEIIKYKFDEIRKDYFKQFEPLSQEDILNRIQQMKIEQSAFINEKPHIVKLINK